MNRAQKEQFVTDLQADVDAAKAFAVMSFNKLNAEQISTFRLALRKQNVRVRVLKNTLAKRVFKTTPFNDVSVHFTGPTLLAYTDSDPVVAAKAIVEWVGKEHYDIKIKSGAALGQIMSAAQITALSKLPGKNELFVSFLWGLKSPPTKFLYALQDIPKRLGYALGALRDKKQNEA